MALPIYLGMMQGEFREPLPEHIAWMESSFSPSGDGLSNLPQGLPPGNLLMVTDQFPPQGHDPQTILRQLTDAAEKHRLCGVVLDFQRPYHEETAKIAEAICSALPCPTALTIPYAQGKNCILFLPPIPVHQSARDYLAPYHEQEIWLETDLGGRKLVLTGQGCSCLPLDSPLEGNIFQDNLCRCHYTIAVQKEQAIFSLQRTAEDLQLLLQDAEKYGVTKALGLYQEMGEVLFVQGGA